MSGRRTIACLGVAGLLCLAGRPLAAAEKPATAADPGSIIYPGNAPGRPESAATRGSSYSAVLVSALFLAAAGGWLFWRGRQAPRNALPLRKLAIAETKSLGNRQYLVVAAYDDRKYLLGVCPGRIELLTALDAPPEKSA